MTVYICEHYNCPLRKGEFTGYKLYLNISGFKKTTTNLFKIEIRKKQSLRNIQKACKKLCVCTCSEREPLDRRNIPIGMHEHVFKYDMTHTWL